MRSAAAALWTVNNCLLAAGVAQVPLVVLVVLVLVLVLVQVLLVLVLVVVH